MTNPTEIVPGIIFYSFLSSTRKDKVGFFEHSTLVLQVAGHFTLETSSGRSAMTAGEMLLIRKNQLGEITKTPLDGKDYQTIDLGFESLSHFSYSFKRRFGKAPSG